MTGLDRDTILGAISAVTQAFAEREAAGLPQPVPADYCISNTAERVVNLILGTARLSNVWDGIRVHD
jgi:UDP-N-acetylglucosamine 2-epimerase (non-hydrolysing)